MTNTISSTDDIINLRDVIERVEELRETLQDHEVTTDLETSDTLSSDGTVDLSDEVEELRTLEALLEDCKGNGGDEQWEGDWYPSTLIRDDYFETAMDELLEDIGDIPKDLPSYLKITVDYEALQMDYTSTEFDGVTYWYR